MKERGVFIEITDLIVPQYGDNLADLEKLVKLINENLGPETPFHLLRFYLHYLLQDLPSTLLKHLKKQLKQV